MTGTVASQTSYLALTQPGAALSSKTAYLVLTKAQSEVASQTAYLALTVEPIATGRRRQIVNC